jgi:hypothetical protein
MFRVSVKTHCRNPFGFIQTLNIEHCVWLLLRNSLALSNAYFLSGNRRAGNQKAGCAGSGAAMPLPFTGVVRVTPAVVFAVGRCG